MPQLRQLRHGALQILHQSWGVTPQTRSILVPDAWSFCILLNGSKVLLASWLIKFCILKCYKSSINCFATSMQHVLANCQIPAASHIHTKKESLYFNDICLQSWNVSKDRRKPTYFLATLFWTVEVLGLLCYVMLKQMDQCIDSYNSCANII